MTVSVIVPTYKRPLDLERCLEALTCQCRPADQVVVVARADDAVSWEVVSAFAQRLPLTTVRVVAPGQVHALNAALDAVHGDIAAITDDDAAPWPEWTQRIAAHFASDPQAGGVGGRDYMRFGGVLVDGAEATVGRIPFIGKHIGNHHLGFGAARRVDILKGANMSYRMAAVGSRRFDTRLRGTGAQIHNDLAFSHAIRRAGWNLIYDPAVAVDHYPAERFDEDGRNTFNPVAARNTAYNETLVRLEAMRPLQAILHTVWAYGIGTRLSPGLAQWFRFALRSPQHVTKNVLATWRGRTEAIATLATAKRTH